MWCCAWGKRLFLCPVVVVLWLGRCGGLTRKVGNLPTLRGGPHAVAAPATLTDLLGARAERVPDCSSYLSRIPWSAADSRLSIYSRGLRGSRRVGCKLPQTRLHAFLNACAAGESTTAGGLEAFSQSSAGAERFENASSKFRWNPSPLLPLK